MEESDLPPQQEQQQQQHEQQITDAVNQYVKQQAPLVQPELEHAIINNGAEESSEPSQEDDSDDVSLIFLFVNFLNIGKYV